MRAPSNSPTNVTTGRVVRSMAVAVVAAYLLGVLTAEPVRRVLEPSAGRPDIALVSEAYQLVEQNYVDKAAIKPQEMAYAAIRAMLETLGDRSHTQFLTKNEREFQSASLRGHFGGIGAEISTQGDRPVIVAPMDGSPAQRAGIRPGDVILAVEGEDTAKMPLEQLILKVRGPTGEPVRLSIQHQGEDAATDLTITREQIQLRSVTSRYFEDEGILHLRLSQFASGGASGIRDAIAAARPRGLRGIVMDVRNNPGGLLDQAVDVTSQFLGEGNVLLEEDRNGKRKPFAVKAGGAATDVPLVVLVNHGSASSAEVFAGALQDYQRAPIVGATTFGTGTVLSSWELRDGSSLLLGFAYWLTPNGRMIRDNGITPDVPIEMASDVLPLTPDREADLSLDEIVARDPQLAAAFQILQSGAPTPPAAGS